MLISQTGTTAPDDIQQSRIFTFKDDRPSLYSITLPVWEGGPVAAGQATDVITAYAFGQDDMPVKITDTFFIQLDNDTDWMDVCSGHNVQIQDSPGDGFYIFQTANVFECLEIVASLSGDARVHAVSPIMVWPMQRTDRYSAYPNDEFFGQLHHLENRSSGGTRNGIDLNVRSAWPYARGEGISIGIADDGIEQSHPDLAGPTAGQPHHDYVLDRPHTNTPSPVNGFHGTNVAGLAAADGGNEIGVSGVAPDAGLTSLVIFGANEFDFSSDSELSRLFRHESDRVQVQNHSWASGTTVLNGPSRIVSQSITNAVTRERGGKGTIIVRSAGNFRSGSVNHPGNGNVNDDRYPSDPHVITVAASDREGKATTYSSPGAPILVAAPSGDSSNGTPNLMTTDLLGSQGANGSSSSSGRPDYAFGSTGFNGTSASAPLIAGLAALILSANPDLHYRDVQYIMAMSARHFFDDPNSYLNGGGFEVNDNVGFGIPDAGLAVRLARDWQSRPPHIEKRYQKNLAIGLDSEDFGLSIPEAEGSANLPSWVPGKPGLGVVNDDRILTAPLTYVGLATSAIPFNLSGQGALIQRGQVFFRDKIDHAADAGAEYAVIYNNAGEDTIIMAETDYNRIPAIFIGQSHGEALRDIITDFPDLEVSLTMKSKTITFFVPDQMIVEHVGLQLTSSIDSRKGVRITLFSPSGTKSELHRINQDPFSGLSNWTFHSAQHFFEPSRGAWRVQISNLEGLESSGILNSLTLMIRGVEIQDNDADGLDDNWENTHFKSLEFSALDDNDHDGYRNGFEQAANLNPNQNDRPFKSDIAIWKDGFLRVSWPGEMGQSYSVFGSASTLNSFGPLKNEDGIFPTTDSIIPIQSLNSRFFQVRENNAN